jgi:hypothetical protein
MLPLKEEDTNIIRKEGTMKKIALCAGVVMCVCLLAFGTAFALIGSVGSDKPEKIDPSKPTQTILIDSSACGKLLSVTNDGSMPQDSSVQRYQLVCDNNGQKVTAAMEVTLGKDGKITSVEIVGGSKAMQGISIKVVHAVAGHEHCVTE